MTRICWINTKGTKEEKKQIPGCQGEKTLNVRITFSLDFSVLLLLFSLVCGALRGKTKSFTEMEANFKVRCSPFQLNLNAAVANGHSKRRKIM